MRRLTTSLALACAALVVGCASPTPTVPPNPTQSAGPSSELTPQPSPSAHTSVPAKQVGALPLEECDPAGYAACDEQRALIEIPLLGTGTALTYSSEWAAGRLDRPVWDGSALGIPGWSLDVLERYDATNHVLLGGDGSWRIVEPIDLPSGETAIASWDGQYVYVFDAAGRQVRTVDGISGTTLLTISYDDAGRLAAIDGNLAGQPVSVRVQRTPDGALQSIASASGGASDLGLSTTVDDAGDLTSVTSPNGASVRLTWAAGGLLASTVGPTGAVTQYTYDDAGRLASTKDPDGVRIDWQRSATSDSVEVRASTAGGATWTYRSAIAGGSIQHTVIDPAGATTTLTADADGHRAVALPDGTTLDLGAQPDPRWGMQAPILTPYVESRPDGVVHRVETARSAQVAAGASPFGVASTMTITSDGATWTQAWDPVGRAVVLTDPDQRVTTTVLDDAGRVTSLNAPGQAALAWTYDDQGLIATETAGAGATALTTSYVYDAATGTMRATLPDGSVETLAVDQAGQTVRSANADGATQTRVYDATGRLVQVTPPGRPSFTLGSSAAGRPTAWLPPIEPGDSSYETDTYNADGQLTTVNGPGDRMLNYSYDEAGRLNGVHTGAGDISLEYNPASGLLMSTTAPGGVADGLTFAGNLLSGVTLSGPVQGNVSTVYDAAGRISSVMVDDQAALPMSYDAAGSLTGLGDLALARDPTSGLVVGSTVRVVATHDEYDDRGRLVRSTTTVAGQVAEQRDYTYDALGRIASVTAAAGSPAVSHVTTYGYDAGGGLASVTTDGTADETDAYDAAGNRVSVQTAAGQLAATYDDRERLLSWGDTSYSYAPDGTLLQESGPAGVTAFTYDDAGILRSVTLPDGRRIGYLVDAAGHRVGRTVDGALESGYLYGVDGRLAARLDGSGNVVARFGWDDAGRLALVVRDGHDYRVITDERGSPLLVVDAQSGEIAEAIEYDAWGNVLSDTKPGFIPVGFAGGLRDPDTGLVLMGARDYDPAVGRWTAPDPIRFDGGDTNLYRYAGGDPINGTDPTGLATSSGSLDRLLGPVRGRMPATSKGPPTPAGRPWYSGPVSVCLPVGCDSHPAVCLFGACQYDPSGQLCVGACLEYGGGLECIGVCGTHGGSYTCIGQCSGRANPCLGFCSSGDPHVVTADGEDLDFQGVGEYLIAESPDGSIVLQARQEPTITHPNVTYATAVAAGVAGDRVAATLTDTDLALTVNGSPLEGADVSMRLPNGGIVERHGTVVTVDWPGGSHLALQQFNHTISYAFTPDPVEGPQLHGLLGSADGNPANDLTSRDGVVLQPTDPDFFDKLYHQLGDSWRVTPAESLFDYGPGQSTATFTRLDLPQAPATVDELDSTTRAQAEALCRAVGVSSEPGLANCTLDVGLTGDPSYAAAAAALAAGKGFGSSAPRIGQLRSIATGDSVAGAIDDPAVHDQYSFAGSAGQIVYLQATGACVDGLSWHLLGPDGTALVQEPSCTDMGHQVPADGTYTIEIFSDGNATGDYAFTLRAVPPVTVTSTSIGAQESGSISQIGEWRDYTFAGSAGQIVYLHATGSCVDGLLWRLIGPDGSRLVQAASCDDIGQQTLPGDGTYTIEIFSGGTAVGDYAFALLAQAPAS